VVGKVIILKLSKLTPRSLASTLAAAFGSEERGFPNSEWADVVVFKAAIFSSDSDDRCRCNEPESSCANQISVVCLQIKLSTNYRSLHLAYKNTPTLRVVLTGGGNV